MGFLSKLFGRKFDPNVARQNNTVEVAKNKQKLVGLIRGHAARIGDGEIRDLALRLSQKVDSFMPCSDLRAIVLDEKIEIMLDAFLREMFKLDEDSLFEDAVSQKTAEFKQKANLKMFRECWQVLERQLQDRKALMSDVAKTDKEVAAMSAPARANYQKQMLAREQVDRVWDVQTAAMEYNLKLANIFCQIQCLEFEIEALLDEAVVDPSMEASISQRCTLLERKVDVLREQEASMYAEIAQNAQIESLIDKNALVKQYNINNSKDGLGLASKIIQYADEALKITEIYEEQQAIKSAAIDKGLAAHKAVGPAAVGVSGTISERLDDKKMQAAPTGNVSDSIAKRLAAKKSGEKPE